MNVPISTAIIVPLAAGLVVLLSYGVARAARRAGLARSGVLGMEVITGLSLWLTATAALALGGVLEVSEGRMPREPLLPPMALATCILLSLTGSFRRLLAALPAWQPVALQAFRIGVELAFWQLYQEGLAPRQVTFDGRNFDGLVGLTALPLAALMALGRVGPRTTIAWNIFGLVALANAIFTAATSAPGPQHLGWPGEPFAAIADWPVVWIPALFAPIGLFLHVLSIRQAVARIGAERGGALADADRVRDSRNLIRNRRVEG